MQLIITGNCNKMVYLAMRSIIYVYGLIICIIDVKLGKTANQYKKSDIF